VPFIVFIFTNYNCKTIVILNVNLRIAPALQFLSPLRCESVAARPITCSVLLRKRSCASD